MIAPQDFSLGTGELTPTMKVKRHFVLDKYKKKIDQMYEHETQSSMWWSASAGSNLNINITI